MKTFESDIRDWTSKVNRRISAIPQAATMEVVHNVRIPVKEGGHMPVRLGNLRNSLEASLSNVPVANFQFDSDDFAVLADPIMEIRDVVKSAKIGDTIHLGFRANYAGEQEKNHAFIRLTAQIWPMLVAGVVTKIKGQIS